MKLFSFILSILIHLIFIFFFILIIKPINEHIKETQIYTVNIVNIEKPKPKQKKIRIKKLQKKEKRVLKKTRKKANIIKEKEVKKQNLNKPKKKIKKIRKVKKTIQKPKPRPKPKKQFKKLIKKINIEKKVKLLKEKLILENIKEKLLKEKIEALKKHILNQEEAEKAYKEKLAYSYVNLIQKIIYNNWGVEKSIIKGKNLITKVEIKLDYLGNLVKLTIVKRSGNYYFDGTVIDAIKSSEPFPKPPKDILSGGMVNFIITFNSKEKE